MATIFSGDNGTKINISLKDDGTGKALDLTGKTVTVVVKTDSRRYEKPVSTVPPLTSGVIEFIMTSLDLIEDGNYQIQPIVRTLNGNEFAGQIKKLLVMPRL